MAKKYTIKKYDGDDRYSWAVFKTADVKGLKSPIFYGQARPIICGMDQHGAAYERDKLEKSND